MRYNESTNVTLWGVYVKVFKVIAVFITICCVFCTCLAGCGFGKKKNEDPKYALRAEQGSSEVAVSFVEALATGDYDAAVQLTEAYSENGFVFASDIEWYLPRSSFSSVLDLGFDSFKSSVKGNEKDETATYTVTLYDASVDDKEQDAKKKSFVINTILNKENLWVVQVPEFYCENFLFRASGGKTVVYIEGKEVSDTLCTSATSGSNVLYKEYSIPYIGKNDVEIRLLSDNFDYTQKVTPNSNNKISNSVSVFAPVQEPSKTFSYIKDSWNALCAKYLAGESASCVQDYIADNASYDLCNIVWDGFEEIHVGDSKNDGIKNENYNLTVCKPSSKGDVYWISDNQIMCYFDYELTWYYILGKTNQSTHQCSSVILSVENDVYKFYEFIDKGLFFEANNYAKEW